MNFSYAPQREPEDSSQSTVCPPPYPSPSVNDSSASVSRQWLTTDTLKQAAAVIRATQGARFPAEEFLRESGRSSGLHYVFLQDSEVKAVVGFDTYPRISSRWVGSKMSDSHRAVSFLCIAPDSRDNPCVRAAILNTLAEKSIKGPLAAEALFDDMSADELFASFGFRRLNWVQASSPAEPILNASGEVLSHSAYRCEPMRYADIELFGTHDGSAPMYTQAVVDELTSIGESGCIPFHQGFKVIRDDIVVGAAVVRHSKSMLIVEELSVGSALLENEGEIGFVMKTLGDSLRGYAREVGATSIVCRYQGENPKFDVALERGGFTLYSNYLFSPGEPSLDRATLPTVVDADAIIEEDSLGTSLVSCTIVEPPPDMVEANLSGHATIADVWLNNTLPSRVQMSVAPEFRDVLLNQLCARWTPGCFLLEGNIGPEVVALSVFRIQGDTISFVQPAIFSDRLSHDEKNLVTQAMLLEFRSYLKSRGVERIDSPFHPEKLRAAAFSTLLACGPLRM